jgi:hypothetical protein
VAPAVLRPSLLDALLVPLDVSFSPSATPGCSSPRRFAFALDDTWYDSQASPSTRSCPASAANNDKNVLSEG